MTKKYSSSEKALVLLSVLAKLLLCQGHHHRSGERRRFAGIPQCEFVAVNHLLGSEPTSTYSPAQISTLNSCEERLMFLGLGICSLQMQKDIIDNYLETFTAKVRDS